MITNLDRLHKVFEMDNPGHMEGRTFLGCHTVAGALESTNENGVICVIPKYNRIDHIMVQMVLYVFRDHGISFHRTCSQTQFAFLLPDKTKKYIRFAVCDDDTLDSLAMIGNRWPVVEFTEYNQGFLELQGIGKEL
jgi:hypothetical protein